VYSSTNATLFFRVIPIHETSQYTSIEPFTQRVLVTAASNASSNSTFVHLTLNNSYPHHSIVSPRRIQNSVDIAVNTWMTHHIDHLQSGDRVEDLLHIFDASLPIGQSYEIILSALRTSMVPSLEPQFSTVTVTTDHDELQFSGSTMKYSSMPFTSETFSSSVQSSIASRYADLWTSPSSGELTHLISQSTALWRGDSISSSSIAYSYSSTSLTPSLISSSAIVPQYYVQFTFSLNLVEPNETLVGKQLVLIFTMALRIEANRLHIQVARQSSRATANAEAK
jgi:hypothetical protein